MESKEQRPVIHRILVAMDASPSSMAAMEAAVDLAAGMRAEVLGLFVEDANILRMAQLPIAQEVSHYTASVRRVRPERIERQLRAQAAGARRALAHEAVRRGVHWTFFIARGDISLELLAKAEGADLIIVGKSGWSGGRRLGSTTRIVIRESNTLTLVVQHGVTVVRPVVAVFDGSEVGSRGLMAAQMLASHGGQPLNVLIAATHDQEARELQDRAAAELRGARTPVAFHRVWVSDSLQLARTIETFHCLLVLPADLRGLSGAPLIDFVDRIECPVLVVR